MTPDDVRKRVAQAILRRLRGGGAQNSGARLRKVVRMTLSKRQRLALFIGSWRARQMRDFTLQGRHIWPCFICEAFIASSLPWWIP